MSFYVPLLDYLHVAQHLENMHCNVLEVNLLNFS